MNSKKVGSVESNNSLLFDIEDQHEPLIASPMPQNEYVRRDCKDSISNEWYIARGIDNRDTEINEEGKIDKDYRVIINMCIILVDLVICGDYGPQPIRFRCEYDGHAKAFRDIQIV